jgi:hypothetical protein
VYTPEALIVPVDALPPVIPFTCQLTAVFEEPLTVAPNDCAALTRTLAEFGETVTTTGAGGRFDPLGLGLSLEEPALVRPEHPTCSAAVERRHAKNKRRIGLFPLS